MAAIHGNVPAVTYPVILFAGFAVAQYQTWRDERQRAAAEQKKAHAFLDVEKAKLRTATETIAQFMGGWNAVDNPELARQMAFAFGNLKLDASEIYLRLQWVISALHGAKLDYGIGPVGTEPGKISYALTVMDTNYGQAAVPLAGAITRATEDTPELETIKVSHKLLVSRLQATGFKL